MQIALKILGILLLFGSFPTNVQGIPYSNYATSDSIQVRITVKFIVTKKGSVKNVSISQVEAPVVSPVILDSCKTEAIRMISTMEGWEPGMQNGRPVRVSYIQPIVFMLPKEE